MNQVHKENLTQVENALPNRQGLEVEIFGMEGIPQEILDQHRNRIIQNFYQAQEDRRIATGNPLPGQAKPARKKLRVESAEELKKRLEEYRTQKNTVGATEAAAPTSASPVSAVCLAVARFFDVTFVLTHWIEHPVPTSPATVRSAVRPSRLPDTTTAWSIRTTSLQLRCRVAARATLEQPPGRCWSSPASDTGWVAGRPAAGSCARRRY